MHWNRSHGLERCARRAGGASLIIGASGVCTSGVNFILRQSKPWTPGRPGGMSSDLKFMSPAEGICQSLIREGTLIFGTVNWSKPWAWMKF